MSVIRTSVIKRNLRRKIAAKSLVSLPEESSAPRQIVQYVNLKYASKDKSNKEGADAINNLRFRSASLYFR